MRHKAAYIVASLTPLFWAASATACPVCGSDTGQQVRMGILDGDILRNLLAVGLPFIFFSSIAAALRFWPMPRRKHHDPKR